MELRGTKFINLKCITVSEFHQGKKSKHMGMKLLETMEEMTQFEMEVPIVYTSCSERTVIETSYYHLTLDKIMREIVPSQMGDYVGLEFYALNVATICKTKKQRPSMRHSKEGEVRECERIIFMSLLEY